MARFWGKVNRNGAGGCWLWAASVSGKGVQHGQFTYRHGRPQIHVGAHRVAWELTNGHIPAGIQVCHHCDVARCVNPAHLFLGTQDDNLKDAASKNRLSEPRCKKLTLADRLAIYHAPRDKGTGVRLGDAYGVSESAITHIRRGRFIGSPLHPLGSGPLPDSRPHPVEQPADRPLDRVFDRMDFLDPSQTVELPLRGEVR